MSNPVKLFLYAKLHVSWFESIGFRLIRLSIVPLVKIQTDKD